MRSLDITIKYLKGEKIKGSDRMTTIDLLKAVRAHQHEQGKNDTLIRAKEHMQLMKDIGIIIIAPGGDVFAGDKLEKYKKHFK